MIVIVDYGMGNLGSVLNMLRHTGAQGTISSDPAVIADASKLILPGVGAFDNGMRNLRELGLVPVLERKVLEQRTPILGICLGMQLFARRSDEGAQPGLGWLAADVRKFRNDPAAGAAPMRIPHMGWNAVEIVRPHPLVEEFEPEPRFYFVHSYYVACDRHEDVLGVTHYGGTFDSIVQRENVLGTQFHPEKSHKFGLKVLKNFVNGAV